MKVNKIKGLIDVSKDLFELLSKEQKLLLEHKERRVEAPYRWELGNGAEYNVNCQSLNKPNTLTDLITY